MLIRLKRESDMGGELQDDFEGWATRLEMPPQQQRGLLTLHQARSGVSTPAPDTDHSMLQLHWRSLDSRSPLLSQSRTNSSCSSWPASCSAAGKGQRALHSKAAHTPLRVDLRARRLGREGRGIYCSREGSVTVTPR